MNNKTSEILYDLLYESSEEEIVSYISNNTDSKILHYIAYNYNWDNGFDIPQIILDNEKCDLSIALLIFYRADGLSYLADKSDNVNLPQWSFFIKRLYDSILTGKYQRGKIEFKVPLSKIQFFKFKKVLTEAENIFIENIEGKCLNIDL